MDLGALVSCLLSSVERPERRHQITVDTVSDAGDQATTYLVTYLLPFFAVEQPTIREVAAYAVFLARRRARLHPLGHAAGRTRSCTCSGVAWKKVVTTEKREVYAVSRRLVPAGTSKARKYDEPAVSGRRLILLGTDGRACRWISLSHGTHAMSRCRLHLVVVESGRRRPPQGRQRRFGDA